MYCYCSLTLIRLLRRHLPRRGRQSAAAGIWADRVVRPYGCGGRSEERAEKVVRPYGGGGNMGSAEKQEGSETQWQKGFWRSARTY